MLQHPEIVAASHANRLPPNIDWMSTFRTVDTGEEYLLAIYMVDYDAAKTMGYEMVFLAGSVALLVALVTILFQSLQAAFSNPAESLRSE